MEIPNITFAQPNSKQFFEETNCFLPFNVLLDHKREHFPPKKFVFAPWDEAPFFFHRGQDKRRMFSKPLHASKWPYLQLFEVHRLAVEDGLFTENLSESIPPEERKVFMKYMRTPDHEFTNLVTQLFGTYREFEKNALFTAGKSDTEWRQLQVALMAFASSEQTDARIRETFPNITEKEFWGKKKTHVEESVAEIVIRGVYPEHASVEIDEGNAQQGRVVRFLNNPRIQSIVKKLQVRHARSIQRDKGTQFVNTLAQLRAGLQHKPLQRHALEVERLQNLLGGEEKILQTAIVCNHTTIVKEVNGVEKKRCRTSS